jgi:pyruvate kinase
MTTERGPGYPSGCLGPSTLRRRWTMSRLLRVGDKVINLDNIEYIIRDGDGVVRIHFIHGDIELWNEQGEAFRQWVLSNAEYCEGSGEGW